MRRDYSPINDLYGVEPDARPSRQRNSVWLLITIILGALFFLESIRPVERLRPNPPSGFVQARTNPDATELSEQERIARSYWAMAVESVQENYPFGTTLPSRPSPGFKLEGNGDSRARTLYWGKLCELWNQREIWVTSYEWNTDWVNGALGSLLTVAKDYVRM